MSLIKHYILNGKEPVEVDPVTWARNIEKHNRVIFESCKRFTIFGLNLYERRVSTMFLGLGFSFRRGQPLLFETMLFGSKHGTQGGRAATWDEAVEMHQHWCDKLGIKFMPSDAVPYPEVSDEEIKLLSAPQ